jgi:hypothetical protein
MDMLYSYKLFLIQPSAAKMPFVCNAQQNMTISVSVQNNLLTSLQASLNCRANA